MTIKEYLEANNLTQREFANLVGMKYKTLNQHLYKGTKIRDSEVVNRILGLGIEMQTKSKVDDKGQSFIYQEQLHIKSHPKSKIYCYSLERVNEMTAYLNKQEISYYVRVTEFCWIIRYDATLRSDEE